MSRRCAETGELAFEAYASAEHRRELAAFVEHRLPVQAIAHLTTPRGKTAVEFDSFFKTWLTTLQEHHGFTIGWIRGDESRPQRHAHILLIAVRGINCVFAAESWRKLVSPRSRKCALVLPYERAKRGIGYVLKSMDLPGCDVRFSPNLAHFGVTHFSRPSTAAERRQLRRIQRLLKLDFTDKSLKGNGTSKPPQSDPGGQGVGSVTARATNHLTVGKKNPEICPWGIFFRDLYTASNKL